MSMLRFISNASVEKVRLSNDSIDAQENWNVDKLFFRFNFSTFILKTKLFTLWHWCVVKVLKSFEMGVQPSSSPSSTQICNSKAKMIDYFLLYLLRRTVCHSGLFVTFIFITFKCKWAVMVVVMSCYLFSAIWIHYKCFVTIKYAHSFIMYINDFL